jgi:protein associated with RNAse G/E
MSSDQVRVVYRKYDGALHWNHPGWRLGEDEHGVWVGVPVGTPLRRGYEQVGPMESAFVILFPPDRWWTAAFNDPPHRTEIYCDISTVPVWPTPDEVTMIDLDLDVRRRRTGEVQILDADEFVTHRALYGYPAEVIAEAEAAATWLADAVRGGVEPFGAQYLRWLACTADHEALVPDA